ncbi:MAG: HU family DNA-binding protein [Deltaproteobacteria bacterium]|jgi:nucleoid DNA-binding protein|tara:strand:+ start:1125 stop:1403 length:279 start_codon:yes stop_codon:yes gene_type:complete
MTKTQLVERLAEAADLNKAQASRVLEALVEIVVNSVKGGDPVKVPGLGTFKKRESKARLGRNPQTGETIQIPARTKAAFTVAKSFKEAVLGG